MVGVLGALAAGCGQQSGPRANMASYLKQVNLVEAALSRPLATVTSIGTQFAQEQQAGGTLTTLVTASHEQGLLDALSRIDALRARLAALRAPRAATHLRGLLLQIIDGQARLTRELAGLVDFLPRYTAALQPLGRATRRLEAALSQNTLAAPAAVTAAYATKAAALRRFKTSVDAVLAQLRELHPPPPSKPGYDGQVAALRGMGSSASELANALTNGSQGDVQRFLLQFDRAATSNETIAAQKARIAAIRSYDGQSAKLANLAQQAEAERLRLADTLS